MGKKLVFGYLLIIYGRDLYNLYFLSIENIGMSSPYFQTSLECLSLLEDDDNSVEQICYMMNIDTTLWRKICNSLISWDLITEIGPTQVLTSKGRNVLSYYKSSQTFFNEELKPQNRLNEIRSRISNLEEI